jgi:uncharacterized protein YsxB (DUF464 family)
MVDETVCILKVEGHAQYAPTGQDIVCSAISALTQTFTTGVEQQLNASITGPLTPGLCDLRIEVKATNKKFLKKIFKVFELGFQKVEQAYPKHVRMNK